MKTIETNIDNGLINVEKIKKVSLGVCRVTGIPMKELNVGDFFLAIIMEYSYSKEHRGEYTIYSNFSGINDKISKYNSSVLEKLEEEIENRIASEEELKETLTNQFDTKLNNLATEVSSQFEVVNKTITDAVEKLTESLNTETTSRRETDETLQNQITETNEKIDTIVDTINEKIDSIVSELNDSISNETKARESADEELETSLNKEVKARENAISNLESDLSAETKARESADNTLKSDFNTALSNETSEREQNIAELKNEAGNTLSLTIDSSTYIITAVLTSIDGTELSRESIDLPLESVVVSGSYDSETKEVILTLKDGSEIRFSIVDLVDGLVNEKDFDKTIEELKVDWEDALNEEKTERESADSELSDSISKVSQDLTTEIADRQKADEDLEDEFLDQLNDEIANRESEDEELSKAIQEESVNRESEDSILESAIEKETEERKTADTEISQAVTNEETRATEKEKELAESITSEATTRETNDNKLETSINEINKGITSINESIDDLNNSVSTINNDIETIQENIETLEDKVTDVESATKENSESIIEILGSIMYYEIVD